MEGIKKNEVYQVTVEGYSGEGLGVARLNGQVLFIHGALAGEVCDVLILKVLKNMAFAKVQKVWRPSPHRREPECPWFGKCGGCAYWHMDYEEELRAKQQKVADALRRLGGAEVDVPILGSEQTLHYRNKAQYPVAPPHEIGFYRARTHKVIPVTECAIQSAAADRIAAAVRQWMIGENVPAYNEHTRQGWLRHVYVRTAQSGDALVCLVATSEKLRRGDSLIAAIRQRVAPNGGHRAEPEQHGGQHHSGRSLPHAVGPELFNGHPVRQNLQAVRAVLLSGQPCPGGAALRSGGTDYAALTGRETVLELYCGTGTITLTLADRAARVLGAEIVPEAIEDAKENARRNGVENAGIFLRRRGRRGGPLCRRRPAARCDRGGPAAQGTGRRGDRSHRGHGAGAAGVCFLRPGYPGARREAPARPRLSR